MKTYFKYFELLTAIIVGLSVFSHIMPFPIIIVNMAIVCCAVYYYIMSCIRYENNDIRFFLKKLSFISICIVCVGTLFRLNYFPGGSFILIVGTIVSFPMLIYYFTQLIKKDVDGDIILPEKESKNKAILFILKILSYLSIGVVCVEVSVSMKTHDCSDVSHFVFLLVLGVIVAVPTIINRLSKAPIKEGSNALEKESMPAQIAFITYCEKNKFTSLEMLIRLCVAFAICLKMFLLAWLVYIF